MDKELPEQSQARPEGAAGEEMEQYLLFEVQELKLGIRVDYVLETIINYSVTPLPLLPEYIRGVINLRGEIIPIVDVRLRLSRSGGKDAPVIVVSVGGNQMGILVDRVVQMVKLRKNDVQPLPARGRQKLVSGMCSLPEGGTMLVLDCPALLEA